MSILAKGGDSCCHEFNAGVYAHQLRDVNLPVEYSPITSPGAAIKCFCLHHYCFGTPYMQSLASYILTSSSASAPLLSSARRGSRKPPEPCRGPRQCPHPAPHLLAHRLRRVLRLGVPDRAAAPPVLRQLHLLAAVHLPGHPRRPQLPPAAAAREEQHHHARRPALQPRRSQRRGTIVISSKTRCAHPAPCQGVVYYHCMGRVH